MTGRAENNNTKLCPVCGGRLQDGTTTQTFSVGDRIVVVKGIPAEVCSDCSEAYVKSGVAGNIEKLLDTLDELESEISVVHYRVA